MENLSIREEVDRAIPRLKELTALALKEGSGVNGLWDREIAMKYLGWINTLPTTRDTMQANINRNAAFLDAMTGDEIMLLVQSMRVHQKMTEFALDVLVSHVAEITTKEILTQGIKHAATPT